MSEPKHFPSMYENDGEYEWAAAYNDPSLPYEPISLSGFGIVADMDKSIPPPFPNTHWVKRPLTPVPPWEVH